VEACSPQKVSLRSGVEKKKHFFRLKTYMIFLFDKTNKKVPKFFKFSRNVGQKMEQKNCFKKLIKFQNGWLFVKRKLMSFS
jgi:hypothetical protein